MERKKTVGPPNIGIETRAKCASFYTVKRVGSNPSLIENDVLVPCKKFAHRRNFRNRTVARFA
jgi:hypothetical protein